MGQKELLSLKCTDRQEYFLTTIKAKHTLLVRYYLQVELFPIEVHGLILNLMQRLSVCTNRSKKKNPCVYSLYALGLNQEEIATLILPEVNYRLNGDKKWSNLFIPHDLGGKTLLIWLTRIQVR